MNTNIQNINSNNNNQPEEVSMNSTDSLIQALVSHFNDNPQGFTSYCKEVEALLRDNIKPLTARSGKTGDDWRSELKSQFSGRGAKWVFVSLEEIEPTLVQFEADGIDCTDYRKNTTKLGKAWIRFNGPRVNDGVKSAAFEVRTEGSTIDHPKQLHMMPADTITSYIEAMPGTPHSLKLEEDASPMPNNKKTAVKKKKKKETKTKEVEVKASSVQEIADDLNESLTLPEPPESSDPSDWEAFLAEEGLDADFGDDDIFESL